MSQFGDFKMQFQDPTLPHLAAALDVSAMQEQFGRLLRAAKPDLEWEPVQCAIEKVYYRPAHHCGILYRLTLRHPSGRSVEEWFFGRMHSSNGRYSRLERIGRATAQVRMSHEFLNQLPPLSVWRDLNMNLWIFPQDPKITTLPCLTDPVFVRRQIEANLPALGVGADLSNGTPGAWRCASLDFDRVKYMPGKRYILQQNVS
jgi:hypothetical protein